MASGVKCPACAGTGMFDGHGHRPHPLDVGDEHNCSECPYPCPPCEGTGVENPYD